MEQGQSGDAQGPSGPRTVQCSTHQRVSGIPNPLAHCPPLEPAPLHWHSVRQNLHRLNHQGRTIPYKLCLGHSMPGAASCSSGHSGIAYVWLCIKYQSQAAVRVFIAGKACVPSRLHLQCRWTCGACMQDRTGRATWIPASKLILHHHH
jgi:hypothetical protein